MYTDLEKNFELYLPPHIQETATRSIKQELITKIREFYFGNQSISYETIQAYIDVRNCLIMKCYWSTLKRHTGVQGLLLVGLLFKCVLVILCKMFSFLNNHFMYICIWEVYNTKSQK